MRTAFSLLLATLFTHAMAVGPCDHVKGVGNVERKPLSVQRFHGIVLEGSMDVVLTQGPEQSVVVEAQPNIAALVTTEVRNGIWIISTEKGYSTDKAFTVRITAPVIDHVQLDGSGDVTSEGVFAVQRMDIGIAGSGNITLAFEATSTKASIQGSGDMKLSGSSRDLTIALEGSGDVNAKELRALNAEVSIDGSGDITLYAAESLEASIAGSGDVNLLGRPGRISTQVMGSGEVRQAGGGPR